MFMHGLSGQGHGDEGSIGGLGAPQVYGTPPHTSYWNDRPRSSPTRLALALAANVRPSFELLLFSCLTAAEPGTVSGHGEPGTPGPRSYAFKLADAFRAHCTERVRVFAHLSGAPYHNNRHGYEYVSEGGGEVVFRSNCEVCLPDAYLLATERVARLSSEASVPEDVVRARVTAAAIGRRRSLELKRLRSSGRRSAGTEGSAPPPPRRGRR